MDIDIAACMTIVRPGAQSKCNANDYNQLSMLDGTVKPTLAELEAAWPAVKAKEKNSTLNASCDAAIAGGFTSTALGTAHTYSCGLNDQTQLTAQAFDAYRNAATPLWTCWFTCKNLAGVKARREHTSAQILLVADAGKLHVATQLSNRDTKVTLVNAALTVEQINAVTW